MVIPIKKHNNELKITPHKKIIILTEETKKAQADELIIKAMRDYANIFQNIVKNRQDNNLSKKIEALEREGVHIIIIGIIII